MPGENYFGLCFPYAVAGRDMIQELIHADEGIAASDVLLAGHRSDVEQMLCFLRWLDDDCDGLISCDDYCCAVLPGGREPSFSALAELNSRWHEATRAPSCIDGDGHKNGWAAPQRCI